MIEEFTKILKELNDSDVFKKFEKENKGYYLAHGFIQLDDKFVPKSPWQIGYYSNKKDNLAVFEVNPTKFIDFEKAFKEEGKIPELKDVKSLKKTKEIFDMLKQNLSTKYKDQFPSSFLLIIQVIDGVTVFNITTVTKSFNMINTRFNGESGEIILDKINSILDLRNNAI
jgi:hypothetical protein